MAAVAMADRVSLESLFRAARYFERAAPAEHRASSPPPRGSPATRAARRARVRRAVARDPDADDGRFRRRRAPVSRPRERRRASLRGVEGTAAMSTSSFFSRARSLVRASLADPGRSLVRVPAYVGDGTTGEPEIIVAGDGAAIVLADEERVPSTRLGSALSRVTLLQLAAVRGDGRSAEPLLGTIDAYWVATLGTTALARSGLTTAVYSSVIAVVAAHGFSAPPSAGRGCAGRIERARRDAARARVKKPAPARTSSPSRERHGVRGGVRVVCHRIDRVRGELRGRGARRWWRPPRGTCDRALGRPRGVPHRHARRAPTRRARDGRAAPPR